MINYDTSGIALTHPAFIDVYFILKKKYYVKEKNIWKLNVLWMHKRGEPLAKDKLEVTPEKMSEFKVYRKA